MKKLVQPMCGINGSNPRTMIDDLMDVVQALDLVQRRMRTAMPHPRDFYTGSRELKEGCKYDLARTAWCARIDSINALRNEITDLALRIHDSHIVKQEAKKK